LRRVYGWAVLELAQVAASAHGRSGNLDETIGILGASHRAMIIVDGETGMIVHANDAAGELFGAPLGGVGVNRLVPERYREAHDALRSGFMRDERARPMAAKVDVLAVTRDHGERHVRIGLTPIPSTSLVIAEVDPLDARV